MAGLDDLDVTTPSGSSTPRDGDNEIRTLKQKVKDFGNVEHYGSGEHKFPIGSLGTRPAPGKRGRFFILTTTGAADELQYDDGTAWVTITRNQDVIDFMASLPDHLTADPIDHPDASVTTAKIRNEAITPAKIERGGVRKGHLDGTTSQDSIAALVDGSNADHLHTHSISPSSLWGSGSQRFTYTTRLNDPSDPAIAFNESIEINLNVSCSNIKKFLVVVRPSVSGSGPVGSDDLLVVDITGAGGDIFEKISVTAPQSGFPLDATWATYYLRLDMAGSYKLFFGGGSGPTAVYIDLNWEIYEIA